MMSVQEISVSELSLAYSTTLRVIDVRETDEYLSGHIPGAIHIPLATVAERTAEFVSDAPVYVVCQSGGRSMRACEYLHDHEIFNVINVVGGTKGWIALGNEIVQGELPG